ncbi:MAG TPA: hypothetical protein VNT75_01780 [Symbiobacteriaceae bacterium]|nr:hypothetical protein [Symbiobacteriaceae bacterium]
MKLEPDERSILASFDHGPAAEAALGALKAAGYSEAQMDRIAESGFKPGSRIEKPGIAGNEPSLTDTVLKPDGLDSNSRILLGASTEVSGLSAPESAGMSPFLITIVTNEAGIKKAVQILKEHGGRV